MFLLPLVVVKVTHSTAEVVLLLRVAGRNACWEGHVIARHACFDSYRELFDEIGNER